MTTSESDFIPYQSTTQLPAGPVLVLAPHPDDEVIGCGGAIMQHVRQGDGMTVVLVTDGAAAEPHEDRVARETYKAKRMGESRAAAAVLGYQDLRSWEAEDRNLGAWPELSDRLRVLLEELRPATIYAPSPYEVHPDHHALGDAVCAFAPALHPGAMIFFYEVGWPLPTNLLLDITPDLERKRQALECFTSQLALQDYGRHMEALNVYRTYTLPASVRAAEGYLVVAAVDLAANPLRGFGRSRLTDRLGITAQ